MAGVDIALRWLIVARKRLDEEGLAHVPLACGCAERLPFADRTFAGVVAGDVIEHVADQAATLAEAHRVLRPGGRLFLASPNRFSLAPEPHVQVWGVGFLPRRWMAAYVRWASGRDFRAIRTLGHRRMETAAASGARSARAGSRPRGCPAADLDQFGPIKRRVARRTTGSWRPGRARRWPGRSGRCSTSSATRRTIAPAARGTTRPTRRGSRRPAAPG